jgi:sporulation protein YlmC with PRC-barrel domain
VVQATQIIKSKVMTADNQNLGAIVNIIIDLEMDLAARLLIFPQQKPWWISWLAQRGGEISIDLIKQALPEDTDQIIKDVADRGSDAALDLWKERLKHRNCYLVSLREIKSIEEQTVNLESDLEQIKKCYCDLSLNEGEIALYPDDALPVEENRTLLPITLNLPNLKGKRITDQEGRKGRIFNVQLEPKKGQVTSIIVETVGVNAGNHLISAEDFDWSTFEAKVTFSTSPFLTLPKTGEKQKLGIPA